MYTEHANVVYPLSRSILGAEDSNFESPPLSINKLKVGKAAPNPHVSGNGRRKAESPTGVTEVKLLKIRRDISIEKRP